MSLDTLKHPKTKCLRTHWTFHLNVEPEVPHTLLMRLDQVQALLLTILNDAHVPDLLGVQAHTAWFQRIAVLVHWLG